MNPPLLRTRYWMTETDVDRLPVTQTEVTFVGRSNVGKSSLICALCQNKTLARVSKTPGRTRGIILFEAVRGRCLVDLPGYGFAEAAERQRDYWPEMIGRYLSERPSLRRVYVLMDIQREPGPIDMRMVEWLKGKEISLRIVATKVDRLGEARQKEKRIQLAEALGIPLSDIFLVSAKKGYGMNALRQDVVAILGM